MKTSVALALILVSTVTPRATSGTAATAVTHSKAYECVVVGPVYLLNQRITDQYQICVPSPASAHQAKRLDEPVNGDAE